MGAAGFEPAKAEPADLQSAPFDHFGIRPGTAKYTRSHHPLHGPLAHAAPRTPPREFTHLRPYQTGTHKITSITHPHPRFTLVFRRSRQNKAHLRKQPIRTPNISSQTSNPNGLRRPLFCKANPTRL